MQINEMNCLLFKTELEDESVEIWEKNCKSSGFSKKLNLVSSDSDYENNVTFLNYKNTSLVG